MPFIKTEKDPEGRQVRVDNGFRTAEGKHYLLLHRLPPEYAKPPTFVVELSNERVEVRGAEEGTPVYYKAYAHQDFSESELKSLRKAKPGKEIAPFFSLGSSATMRVLGRKFYCLSEDELTPILDRYVWKLVGGQR